MNEAYFCSTHTGSLVDIAPPEANDTPATILLAFCHSERSIQFFHTQSVKTKKLRKNIFS